jgi:hypothetical protein
MPKHIDKCHLLARPILCRRAGPCSLSQRLGAINSELLDLTIAVTDAQFSQFGTVDCSQRAIAMLSEYIRQRDSVSSLRIAVIIAEPDDRIFSRQDYAVHIYSAHIGYLHGSFW